MRNVLILQGLSIFGFRAEILGIVCQYRWIFGFFFEDGKGKGRGFQEGQCTLAESFSRVSGNFKITQGIAVRVEIEIEKKR